MTKTSWRFSETRQAQSAFPNNGAGLIERFFILPDKEESIIMRVIKMMREISPLFLAKGAWPFWAGFIVLCFIVYLVIKG